MRRGWVRQGDAGDHPKGCARSHGEPRRYHKGARGMCRRVEQRRQRDAQGLLGCPQPPSSGTPHPAGSPLPRSPPLVVLHARLQRRRRLLPPVKCAPELRPAPRCRRCRRALGGRARLAPCCCAGPRRPLAFADAAWAGTGRPAAACCCCAGCAATRLARWTAQQLHRLHASRRAHGLAPHDRLGCRCLPGRPSCRGCRHAAATSAASGRGGGRRLPGMLCHHLPYSLPKCVAGRLLAPLADSCHFNRHAPRRRCLLAAAATGARRMRDGQPATLATASSSRLLLLLLLRAALPLHGRWLAPVAAGALLLRWPRRSLLLARRCRCWRWRRIIIQT